MPARAHRALLLVALCAASAAGARAAEGPRAFSVSPGDEGTLVLHRPGTEPGTLEGLVVDSERLVAELKARVLEARGLGEVAELEGGSYEVARRGRPADTPYVFTKRFGAPFESVNAELRLQPLLERDGGSFMLVMTALFGVALVFGLYGLYRMTATQLEFAARRNNFVAAVSHELKTPLTAIRMYAEMLEGDLVEGEARRREYYRTITAESERLSRLINNVLELSRVERKSSQLTLLLGDVRPVVNEVIDVLGPHAQREGFVLEADVREPLPDVCFDPDALKQVLFNLIDNALKYGAAGAERRIRVRLETAALDRLTIAVRDHGPGVRREHLTAIFQPFFRSEDELTRRTQGTGIGLSLVRGLVERMGGHVNAQNAEPGLEVSIELAA